MRYLGVDYGSAHIGFAIGDDETKTAFPLQTAPNTGLQSFINACHAMIQRESVGTVVVGVPALGPAFEDQKKHIDAVIDELKKIVPTPVVAWDESFSSRQARTLMRDRGPSRDTDEHAIAAMLVLQSYLERAPRV